MNLSIKRIHFFIITISIAFVNIVIHLNKTALFLYSIHIKLNSRKFHWPSLQNDSIIRNHIVVI